MKRLGAFWLGFTCMALFVATGAEAQTLTQKKARAALKPVAAQVAPTVATALAPKLPGATISKSGVGPCVISKKRRRAACVLTFGVQGASTGKTECAVDALVEFKSKKSKRLKTSVGSVAACAFPVKLA
jgi:hypothetical protein